MLCLNLIFEMEAIKESSTRKPQAKPLRKAIAEPSPKEKKC